MPFQEVIWHPITFSVPAMLVPVFTVKDGKKTKKTDDKGGVVYDSRIIPKGRPRLGRAGQTHTPETTVAFEKWIRNKFFQEYPGSYAVMCKNKPVPVDQYFMGCQRFGEMSPCILFRNGSDFVECSSCAYRRKNLGLSLKIYFKDEKICDIDNVIKIVLDALNSTCFYDDSQFILKEAKAYYNAIGEQIDISISKLSTTFEEGCLKAGYSFKKLSVKEALDYITFLIKSSAIVESSFFDFISYLRRCDGRKYVGELTVAYLKRFMQ